jgi:hypothetical protein
MMTILHRVSPAASRSDHRHATTRYGAPLGGGLSLLLGLPFALGFYANIAGRPRSPRPFDVDPPL